MTHEDFIGRMQKEMEWFATPDYQSVISDKGLGKPGVMRHAVINLLHLAHDEGIDVARLLGSISRGYVLQSDHEDRTPFYRAADLLDP
jgi:hypothetical protein